MAAKYVAIITDGNGRWAQGRGLSVAEGHRAGADVVKARLKDAGEVGADEEHRSEVELQKLTDQRIAELDAHLKHKEEEILEV